MIPAGAVQLFSVTEMILGACPFPVCWTGGCFPASRSLSDTCPTSGMAARILRSGTLVCKESFILIPLSIDPPSPSTFI